MHVLGYLRPYSTQRVSRSSFTHLQLTKPSLTVFRGSLSWQVYTRSSTQKFRLVKLGGLLLQLGTGDTALLVFESRMYHTRPVLQSIFVLQSPSHNPHVLVAMHFFILFNSGLGLYPTGVGNAVWADLEFFELLLLEHGVADGASTA